jgi:glycine hydroxymethyltransferase
VTLKESMTPAFKKYTKQIIHNTKTLEKELKRHGFNLVSGGTDKHLLLVDLRNLKLKGNIAARKLAEAGIITNKNSIPHSSTSPVSPDGIRIGTPWVTTRGMKEKEMIQIAEFIKQILIEKKPPTSILREVKKLTSKFPIKF